VFPDQSGAPPDDCNAAGAAAGRMLTTSLPPGSSVSVVLDDLVVNSGVGTKVMHALVDAKVRWLTE